MQRSASATPLPRDPVIAEIAAAHGRNPSQVALRWLLDQPNVAAVPNASSREHLGAKLEIFDLELSDEERVQMAGLERSERTINPSWAPAWDGP